MGCVWKVFSGGVYFLVGRVFGDFGRKWFCIVKWGEVELVLFRFMMYGFDCRCVKLGL